MAQAAVVAAVLARLASGFSRCPVQDNNVTGDTPADGSSFLAVEFPVSNEKQIGIGSPGANTYREEGVILLLLSIQRGAGITQGNQWAGELAALFRGQQFSGVTTGAVVSPTLGENNDSGSYWKLPIKVFYHFDILA